MYASIAQPCGARVAGDTPWKPRTIWIEQLYTVWTLRACATDRGTGIIDYLLKTVPVQTVQLQTVTIIRFLPRRHGQLTGGCFHLKIMHQHTATGNNSWVLERVIQTLEHRAMCNSKSYRARLCCYSSSVISGPAMIPHIRT